MARIQPPKEILNPEYNRKQIIDIVLYSLYNLIDIRSYEIIKTKPGKYGVEFMEY